jgi:hypothetical protein
MTVNVGDGVRITESAREEMLAYRQEGRDTDAIRENRVGTALEQVGVRGRHRLIAFWVDFGDGIKLLLPEEVLEQA